MSIKQLIIIALGLLFLYGLFTVGAPFLLAIVFAIIIEPVNKWLMRTLNLKRIPAATITSTMLLLLILGIIFLMGMQLFLQLTKFWENAPLYFHSAQSFTIKTWNQTYGMFENLSPEAATQIESLLSGFTGYLGSIVNTLSKSFLDLAKQIPNMFVFFLVFIVAVYLFSYNMDTLRNSVLSFFDEKSHRQVSDVLMSLKKSVFGFIRAQFIFSTFTYVVTLIGLFILGVQYPMAVALLVTIVDILPILGVGSALVPWAIYSMLTGDLFLGGGLIILFVIITALRKIIEPKVLGNAVGIGALPALISLYVGFKLVGVIGFFLGPVVVLIYIAMRRTGLFQIKISLH